MAKLGLGFAGVAFCVICLGIWIEYLNSPLNMVRAEPEISIKAESLMVKLGQGKVVLPKSENIVEIEGIIHEMNTINNRLTILLEGGMGESAYIICDMQPNQQEALKVFKVNDTIKIKGVYMGFLKDVIILNCIISPR